MLDWGVSVELELAGFSEWPTATMERLAEQNRMVREEACLGRREPRLSQEGSR